MRQFAMFLIMASSLFGAIHVESGAVDVTTYFVMRDATAGTRDTTIDIAGDKVEMYYIVDQAAESADAYVGIHGGATDAHTDGECIHVGHGVYRVDWPDAAFAGAAGTRVQLTFVDSDAGAFTETLEVLLSPPVDISGISLEGSNVIQIASGRSIFSGNGSETNTYTATQTHNGTYYEVAEVDGDGTGDIAFYLEFDIGADAQPVDCVFHGRLDEGAAPSGGDEMDVYAYNWGGTDWEHISPPSGDIVGVFNSDAGDDETKNVLLNSNHVGTAGNVGLVRIAFTNYDPDGAEAANLENGTELYLDYVFVNYQTVLRAADVVNEWETQSQADPTGFHVNVLEIEGGDATDALDTAAATVTVTALAANVITSASINDGAISDADVDDDVMVDVKTIETGDATDALDTAAATVTVTALAANVITAASINASAIGASELAEGAIGASEIATDAIGSNEIAANAIGGSEVATDAIDADAIKDGAIDAATFAADVDGEIATYIWNAAVATYGGAGTYGQDVEDILVDTGTTLDDFLDTEIAAIMAVTDVIPNAGALTDIAADLNAYDTDAEYVAAIWGATMENSKTYAEVMRVMAAVLSGKSSSAAGQMNFVGIDGSTTRLTVTVSSGARTSVDAWDGS